MSAEHQPSHRVGLAAYCWTYLALLVLATVAWLIADFVPAGAAALAVALLIGGIKALLVIGFFIW